jgi:AraC-like DNA-binding protein
MTTYLRVLAHRDVSGRISVVSDYRWRTQRRASAPPALDMIVAAPETTISTNPTRRAHATDLRRAQDLLRVRLNDKQMSVAKAAAELGMSVRYLQKIFQVAGTTPSQWLLRTRLERARILLLTTDLTISELTSRVGFKDISHFSRSFRNQYGASPGRYRNAILMLGQVGSDAGKQFGDAATTSCHWSTRHSPNPTTSPPN